MEDRLVEATPPEASQSDGLSAGETKGADMADMTREQRAQVEAFLAESRNAVVGTIRRDGRPRMTPNWYWWDGSHFYVSTTKTRRKYADVRRDPRVQLLFDDAHARRSLLVDGTVAVREPEPDTYPTFRAIRSRYIRAGAEEQDNDALRERLTREQRVLFVITPDKPLDQWSRWGFD